MKTLFVGQTVRVKRGLGEGQTVPIRALVTLPMGTGVEVVLDGDYRVALNPADVEPMSMPSAWLIGRRDQYMAIARQHQGTAIAETYVGMARTMNHDALESRRKETTK